MRNRKLLLYVLIPLIIVVLILIAGIIFLKINSSPEKVYEQSISKVFEMFETSEEHFSTMKGSLKLTANVESQEEQMQAINTILEGTSIGLNMQVDTTNMVVNDSLNVVVNNESLLNAAILLQDQKGYLYLPDWLDKYLQIPEEDMEYSELTDFYDKIATLDQNTLMEAIKEELIEAISRREFTQDKIDKRKVSTLDLSQEEFALLCKEILVNLKQNEMFNNSLGEYKEDLIATMEDMIAGFEDVEYDDDSSVVISIYTEGLLNRFAGFSIELIDGMDIEVGMLLAFGKEQKVFTTFKQYDGEREDILKLTIEDKKESKNKGTATITMTVDEEQFVVIYDYEKQGKQLYFSLSTEIEGIVLSLSGNVVENGSNVKGVFVVSIQEETVGRINLNCAYDFTYDVQVQKVDAQNAVSIDELSEEDQTELITNFQNSTLYQLIGQIDFESGMFGDYTKEDYNDEPEVTYSGYTARYAVPDDFYRFDSYEDGDAKAYMDDNFNTVTVSIDYIPVESYMEALDDEYVLTSSFYQNQKISDTKTYEVNGKEYKFRTITYDFDNAAHIDLYFAYEIDDEYCYIVEVETEVGKMSMETIKNFLNVTVK